MSLQVQCYMIYMQYVTTLGQWTWATTQPAVLMKMVGASTMTPGETSCTQDNGPVTCIWQTVFIRLLYLWVIYAETLSASTLICFSRFLSLYSSAVWLQSQRTSFRPIKPMCCSTSAATAPPLSGNRAQTGWVRQPIRATLPPVTIETNRSSTAVTLASWNLSASVREKPWLL